MYLIYRMHPVYSNLSESDSIYPFKFKLFYLFYLCDLFIFYSTLFYSVLFRFILFYCLLLYPVLSYSLLFPIYCRYLEPNNLFRIREISYKWCWTEWAACMSGDVPQIYSTGKMDQWNSDFECQPSDFSIAWPEAKNSCEIPKRVLRFGDDLTHWWPSNGLWHWLCHIPETIAGNHHFFSQTKRHGAAESLISLSLQPEAHAFGHLSGMLLKRCLQDGIMINKYCCRLSSIMSLNHMIRTRWFIISFLVLFHNGSLFQLSIWKHSFNMTATQVTEPTEPPDQNLKNLTSVFLFTCFLSNVLHKMMLLNVIFYTHCKYTHIHIQGEVFIYIGNHLCSNDTSTSMI